MLKALKVGTVVCIVSSGESLNGLVVPVPAENSVHRTLYESEFIPKGLAYVLITTAGEFQGKMYPFQNSQLEVISESS